METLIFRGAKQQINNAVAGAQYSITMEADTIAVPVVMMVEGVHSGSDGAVLHTKEGLTASVAGWDNMPVVIQHPQSPDGTYISANSEGVVSVGSITQPKMVGDKLKAILVLNKQSLLAQSPQAMEAILNQHPIDVSIGAYTADKQETGEWGGETYQKITEAYTPDHLAILPGAEGACNWADGCGIRVNQSQLNKEGEAKMNVKEQIKDLLKVHGVAASVLSVNVAQGFQERIELAYRAVDALDSDSYHFYLEEMYEDHIIYRRRSRNNNQPTEARWYKQMYKLEEAGTLILEGEPERVIKETTYTPYQGVIINKKEENKEMNAKVQSLIENPLTAFTKCDVQWLELQTNEVLDKLVPIAPETVELNDESVRGYMAKYSKTEEVVGFLPESLQAIVTNAVKAEAAKKIELIEKIQNNAKDTWEVAELTAMGMEMLEKIDKSMGAEKVVEKEVVDYSAGAGVQVDNATEGVEPLPIVS